MVRETRHLWVGNLPENIREDRIREHFKRYGRVQSVKLLPRGSKDGPGAGSGIGAGSGGLAAEGTLACTVAFMDIKSASKAHTAEHKLEERTLTTEYYEPAAIPSAAAPQTPERTSVVASAVQGYTPTNAAARFPNSHGSSEEHSSFSERFYERGGGRVADAEYLRRPGYHDTARGRARDRLYRNGPYPNAIIERGHRSALATPWPYEAATTRYTTNQPADATYVSTPPVIEPTERRSSSDAQIVKKKSTQSRSGSRTPSPSGSTSSRSPSRSRSRSSSSSSSSTTSRGSSSPTSSPRTRGGRVQSSVSAAPPVHSEDRRPLAICVRNLPARSSDTSLKDGLFHEYKKHGKVTWVKVVGQSSDRYALVCFKKPDDVEKALEVSYDKLFFGCKIEVGPYQGYDVEDNEFRPYEAELDEYHPKATRTLFIGNLEKDVTASDLRKHFDQFGEIIEIDIKKQGAVSSYAFCQYSDIVSVVKAIRKMDGEHLGNNRIKLGFGKSMPTNCVWVDGVSERVDEKHLTLQFERYGQVTQVSIDRDRGHSLIFFDQVSCAQTAVKEMRGVSLRGKKLQVDFASRECQDTFFDHLEKQGAGGERPPFDSTRDTVQRERTFESSTLAASTRYNTRYETPSRPRTSSYSSRSGTGSQCTGSSAVPSPGTPGSVTPRGSGSRSRLTRYNEYYEAGVEYPERRFRSYDEFSQGSGASHEDVYEHEYIYSRESPGHIEPVEPRTMQSVVVTTEIQPVVATFVPPDIRHLQKERVHLLEQLDECPSSGDELMSPKKRLKLDLCETIGIQSEVVDMNHSDHRKVIEVRRLSDTAIKHHSRRPSIDGKHCVREIPVERVYLPHAVCKRRKTSGSESDRSRIHHHHDMSGSESLAGSRPGTPLCDERPENLPPSEPRRLPRERNVNEGPLSLPLPRFAAQVLNSPRLNISVAGFKGSKENIVSSPPAAVTSPKVVNPVPPSPVHVPPPASPPPRPPSSSNSSDSDAAPPSPSLEERLRSLDEKYEKWSGSRTLCTAGSDALAKLDASSSERFRFRHNLLDIDLKELQPSEIVKSVLAKRSVFDEDSKRLENVGEKYEPREFTAFPRTFVSLQSTIGINTPTSAVPPSPVLSPAATQTKSLPGVSPTIGPIGIQVGVGANVIVKPVVGTVLSPRSLNVVSTALPAPAAKGLQYPFPSHPPVMSTVVSSGTALPASAATAPAPSPARVTGNVHSDNTRLKLCPSLPSDRTTSKVVNLNRSGCVAVVPPPVAVVSGATVASTVPKHKSLDKNGDNDKINSNIPIINSCESASMNVSTSAITVACSSSEVVTNHVGKTPPRDKSASRKEEKAANKSEKVAARRDSVSSSPSSSGSVKCERKDKRENKKSEKDTDNNGDYRTVKSKDSESECDKKRDKEEGDYCDKKLEEEKQRIAEREKHENERKERERIERERQEHERQEIERLEKERLEKERNEKERQEKERLEKELQEKERLEKERLEKDRVEKEHLEKERLEKERLEKEKLEKEKQERIERERLEKERKREREERERREREEREKREKEEQLEREKIEKEKQRERKEKEEKERRERGELEREKERQEKELLEKQIKEKLELRKREKELEKHERRHKEDNHESKEKKKEEYEKGRPRENHSDNTLEIKNKHRENHIDSTKVNERHRENHDNRKDNKDQESRIKDSHDHIRNNHEMQRKDSHDKTKDYHDNSRINDSRREEKHSSSHCSEMKKDDISKNRHHNERDIDLKIKKDGIKDIRENNSHDKVRHFSTESRENNRNLSTDSRHSSTDTDKIRPYTDALNSTPNRPDASKRKDKLNHTPHTPASVGCKRRISSQDSSESPDDSKRLKIEHRKISERRDSKDSRDSNNSRSSDKPKQSKHNKSNFTRMLEDKIREEKRNKELSDEKRKEKERDRERDDKYKLKQAQKIERQKIKSKNRDSKDSKDSPGTPKSSKNEIMLDKDFLARLDLRANEEDEKQNMQRRESKEKRKQENHDLDERRSSDDSKRSEERKKNKCMLGEKKHKDECMMSKNPEDKCGMQHKKDCQRIRKSTNSSDTSDSDEPKKHSIFDIVDDEPAYISMYDKVKARSCKNMQKQEEEKRQEKLKAKFTQLKQSRAKREEKKRSTSWDEDSDSDHIDTGSGEHPDMLSSKLSRRGNKMLITSSSEDEMHSMEKSRQKSTDMYTDSDSDLGRNEKHERHMDTTDDEHLHNKSMSRKGSRSRITSDTSEDEHLRKRLDNINKDRYSDSEVDQGFADSDEKPDMKHYKKPKEEKFNHYDDDKYIKKEKKPTPKLHNLSDDENTRKMLTDAVKAEIFGDKEFDLKIENNRYTNRLALICDISSENETMHPLDNKKDLFGEEKSEMRKKHKKKQKRLKNSLLSEDAIKIERMIDDVENETDNRGEDTDKSKLIEKKKHGSKKDKKRDKVKDEDRNKDKSKKLKKLGKDICSKADLHALKKEGKLEDIFGSFSDDSETGNKDSLMNSIGNKENNSFFVHLSDKLQPSMYASDSDSVQLIDPEREKLKEESRKRKEKKRKEKERRLREENENSVDFADLGKVLEDNLKDENNIPDNDEKSIKTEIVENHKPNDIHHHNNADVFRFSEGEDNQEVDKKEFEKKEKRKKRKKSKEEKQNRHHHHHHEKNVEKLDKINSPDLIKKEPLLIAPEDIKEEPHCKPPQQSPSLPNLLDMPSPPQTKNNASLSDFAISPIPREPLISPIPKTPTSIKTEKKREKFIPGFGSEIDEKIHESAVKSISDFGSPTLVERLEPEAIKIEEPKLEKVEPAEDKPRVIISQEETEDAVAALLGESFGGGDFDDCYNESQSSPPNVETSVEAPSEEVIAEDDEEMRQAVQSLNSSDLEVKPDTPQSENDLQIDTDTDDGEEIHVRYAQSPRTPDMVDLSRPPKTPDYPSYYRVDESAKISTAQTSVLIKTPAIESPLAQIKTGILKEEKSHTDVVNDIKRNLEIAMDKPVIKSPDVKITEQKRKPALVEPPRTVISQSWSVHKPQEPLQVPEKLKEKPSAIEHKKSELFVATSAATVNHVEQKPHIAVPPKSTALPLIPQLPALPPLQPTVLTSPQSKSYLVPPVIKISEHTSSLSVPPTVISPKIESSLSPLKAYNNLDMMSKIPTSIPSLTAKISTSIPTNLPAKTPTSIPPALTTVVSKARPLPQQIPAAITTKPIRLQQPVISHLPNASPKTPTSIVISQNTGLLTTVVTSTPVLPNRLPIQAVMASKPMQPTPMTLPQSKIAVSTIQNMQKIVSTPEATKLHQEVSRMVYNSTGNLTLPSYSYPQSLVHHQAIPTTTMHLPGRTSVTSAGGLLTPSRHVLPVTSYAIPPTTRSVSPLVKEAPKSVIEKTLPNISEIQKPVSVSLPSLYSQTPFTPLPTSLHIMNTDLKPSTHVIQEVPTPKLIPLLSTVPSDARVSQYQHSIIQQAPSQKIIGPVVSDIIRQSPVSPATVPQNLSKIPLQSQTSLVMAPKPVIPASTVAHSIISHPVISHPKISQTSSTLLQPPILHSTVSLLPTMTTRTVMSPKPVLPQTPHLVVSQPIIPKTIISQATVVQSSSALPIITHTSLPKPQPIISHSELPLPSLPESPIVIKSPLVESRPLSAVAQEISDTQKIIKEITRSTISPVIVSTPKEQVASPLVKEVAAIKKEEIDSEIPALEPLFSIPIIEKATANSSAVKEEMKPIIDDIKKEILEPKTSETVVQITVKEENKQEEEKPTEVKPNCEPTEVISVIKETENYEKEKEDSESVISEPKESLTSELSLKDDPLDSKEDSDYWSAKEVNIESVIKKVDALCSADELSEGSEVGKDDWFDLDNKILEPQTKHDESVDKDHEKSEDCNTSDISKTDAESEHLDESLDNNLEEKEVNVKSSRRGGRMRGRKNNKSDRLGVTTRRGKAATTPSKRGGRGGRTRNDKKVKTSESDVYEFHDDSDENKDRPRLILTIKSPAGAGNTPSTPSAIIKETPPKKLEPPPPATPEQREDFVSPATNTRKSRRIQERDGSRNTIDDIIEDVVRNAAVVTRSVAAAAAQGGPTGRRSTRQNAAAKPLTPVSLEPRKSPRGSRRKDRRVSENTDDSSEEKAVKKDEIKVDEPLVVKEESASKEIIKVPPKLQEKEKVKIDNAHPPIMGLKANLIRRVKSEEPITLIDPTTGLLTQMRECEEGKYIPVSGAASIVAGTIIGTVAEIKKEIHETCRPPISIVANAHSEKPPITTVIAKPQPAVQAVPKPQSLKAHVLSAAKVVVSQPKPATVQTVPQPTFIQKPTVPVNQNLNVNVSLPSTLEHTNLSPRQSKAKSVHIVPPAPAASPMSPNHQIGAINNPKQHFLQAVPKQLPPKPSALINPKAHLLNAVNQNLSTVASTVVNASMNYAKSHMTQPATLPSPVKQQVVVAKVAPLVKPHNLHVPQQILTGAVASPPLKHHIAQQPIVTGASSGRMSVPSSSPMPGISAKGAVDPQKVEVSMAGCVMISHPTVSPQAQARGQVLQAGMPVPAYEASLHGVGDHPLFSRQSPPPAHQQTSPAPQGDGIPYFSPGAVLLRHDLPSQHFMHSHSVYQQYLRAQQEARIPYHLPRSPMVSGGLEKTKDGQEGEEAPVTSPPLELRRPGSVGLTGRPAAVPHSLQSPHDRATDSPQVAQVYMHQARMPYHHTATRFYEPPTEPPPAHRPVTCHTALTVPGSSLGAAGNLTGALARHIGAAAAEAPTTQRGLQVATPPHASQVPPQADSLLVLLKQYQIMWQGLLALKNDQAAVQMHFVFGNPHVARSSLPYNRDGSTPPLRIAQRMRLEKTQVEGVARKMQIENEHCVLLALPCGHDHMDVLQQSMNLSYGFITYLQQKEAAGIINIAAPGSQQAAYVVHIFPSCDFVNQNLARIAPNLLHRVADIAHLLIVIATV